MNSIEWSDIEGERYPGEFSEWRRWQASGLNAPTIQDFREFKEERERVARLRPERSKIEVERGLTDSAKVLRQWAEAPTVERDLYAFLHREQIIVAPVLGYHAIPLRDFQKQYLEPYMEKWLTPRPGQGPK